MDTQQVQAGRTQAMVRHFEGRPLTVREWKGRPCVVAGEFGTVLGYAQGRKLTDQVMGAWAEEFVEGSDFAKLNAAEAREIQGRQSDSTVSVESLAGGVEGGARSLTILYESGMYLAAVKARTALGRRVRRWLASEVLPEIARTGAYQKSQPVQAPDPEIHTRLSIAVSEATYRALDAAGRELNVAPAQIGAFVLTSWRYLALTLVPGAIRQAADGAVVEAFAGLGTPSRKIIEESDRTGLMAVKQTAQAPVVPTPLVAPAPAAPSAPSMPSAPMPPPAKRGRPRKMVLPAPAPAALPAPQPVIYHPLPSGPVLTPRPSILTHGGAFHIALLDAWEALCADGFGRSATQAVTAIQSGRAPAGLKHVADMLKGAHVKLVPSNLGKVLSRFRRVEVGGRWFDVQHTSLAQVWRVERAQRA